MCFVGADFRRRRVESTVPHGRFHDCCFYGSGWQSGPVPPPRFCCTEHVTVHLLTPCHPNEVKISLTAFVSRSVWTSRRGALPLSRTETTR